MDKPRLGGVRVLLAALAFAVPPPPATPLPERPDSVADALAQTTSELHRAIDAWQAGPLAAGSTPRNVTLWALHQQRLFLKLTYEPELGRHAGPLLSREARATLAARRRLVELTPPTLLPLSSFRTGPALPAQTLLRYYHDAERRLFEQLVVSLLRCLAGNFEPIGAGVHRAGECVPVHYHPQRLPISVPARPDAPTPPV